MKTPAPVQTERPLPAKRPVVTEHPAPVDRKRDTLIEHNKIIRRPSIGPDGVYSQPEIQRDQGENKRYTPRRGPVRSGTRMHTEGFVERRRRPGTIHDHKNRNFRNRDDLTLINSIGPATQRKLYELNITSFDQLSRLTPEQINRLQKDHLHNHDIRSQNWVAQSRRMLKSEA